MRKPSDLAVGMCSTREFQASEGMSLRRAARDTEMLKEGLAHEMRGMTRSGSDADVHARLTVIRRQELRVTIGEMQQAYVAERRQFVKRRALASQHVPTIKRKATGSRDGQDVQELTTIHLRIVARDSRFVTRD